MEIFMVLEQKKTTVAYRCPHCGAGVLSMVDVFALGADMVKLKCDCGKSEMSIIRQGDGKIRLSVPCILCPKPHSFLLNPAIFFGKDSFFLQCPYSDINICFLGETNLVKAELARTELELLDIMEKNGINDFSALHEDGGELPDPEIQQIVLFVLGELEAENKIHCKCPPQEHNDSEEGKYDIEITNDGILVSCPDCGAKRLISTDNYLDAHSFLYVDDLFLE